MSQQNFVNNDNGFQRFSYISLATLNKHAPCKIEHVRGNQMPFLDKELLKPITTRTKLRNNFLQNKSVENRMLYAKERNFCVSLLRTIKNRYYENLNEKSVIDNKLLWKTVKPFFSDKIEGKKKIHLTEYGELIKADLEAAEILNDFFSQT